MTVVKRVVRYAALGVVALLLLAVGAVLALTRTGVGVEQTGQLVLSRLDRSISGTLTVADIRSPSLLQGAMLRGVEIADAEGRPFVRADSVLLGYRISTFLAGAVVFDRLEAYGLDVTVERLPGDAEWNYDRVFADPKPGAARPATDTAAASDGGRIRIRDVTVHSGRVTVRTPWDEGGDPGRNVLEQVPGGRVRTLRFEDVRARLPRIVWEDPGTAGRVIDVAELTTRAHIFEEPLEVRSLEGQVTIRDSVIGFDVERARLPDSELRAGGTVTVTASGNRYDVDATGSRVALRDFQWLHPPLPSEGGGSLRFRIQSQEDGDILWLAQDAEIETLGNALAGSFGVVTGGTLRFQDVDVRATPLDLDFLAGLLPDGLPISGLVMGTLEADGPVTALRTRGDVRYRTFDEAGNGAESDLRWSGVLGWEAPYVVRDAEAELVSVELAQVAQFAPALRLRGRATGTLRASGSLEGGVEVHGDVTVDQDTLVSAIEGTGRFALGGTPTFDLQFDAQPVALEMLALQLPALEGLRGEARGPVTVTGSLDDLTVGMDVATPAGQVVVQGSMGLTGRTRYRAEGSVTEFRLDRVASGLPETMVTARFGLDGSGAELADLEGSLSVDLLSASVGGVEIYRGALRGSVGGGVATVDSFMLVTEAGDAEVQGDIGLVEGRTGELAVSVRADSLLFLEPLLFGESAPAALGIEEPPRIDGLVTVEGRLTGSIPSWRASGTGRIRSLLYGELELGRARLEVAWQGDSLRVDGALDSLRYGSRRLATAQAGLSFAAGRGVVTAQLQGRRGQQLDVESAFEPEGEVVNLGLRRLRLATRDGEWSLADTAHATVGGEGVSVDSMVLVRTPARARIRVAGVLPWRPPGADEVQEASLVVDVDSVRIGELLRVTQTDTLVDGVVTGGFTVTGTALAPAVQGRIDVRNFRYGGAVLDSVRGEVAYAARVAEGSFTGWRGDASIITGEARVPLQLALTEEADRLLDEPMSVEFRADGVPAGLLAFLTPGFTGLEGLVQGRLAVLGTPVEPDLRGTLELTGGAAYFEPLAVAYREVRATARMTEGTQMEVDARLRTENGRGQVRGTLDLAEPGDPAFDLSVFAQSLDATRRRDVTAVVNGEATVRGRYSRPIVSGDMRIVRGEMNLDEIWRQHQIVQLDTTLFQMLDTTQVSYRPTPENPFLRNLRVTGTTVSTDRNFWLRSQELNVEVSGELSLEVDRQTDDFRLTGELEVLEGSYQLLARGLPSGRRFDIREGAIEFVGTPGIDPNLDIEAAYRVRRAQGEPINVIASVTGTLQDPRVSLTSDSEVPMSETDLASYILFGRAGAELTQAELDAVSTGGALAVGLFRPVFSGAASTGIQQVATSLGLPVDYVAFNLPEYGAAWQEAGGGMNIFGNAQIEVGFDAASNVSVILSGRIPGGEAREERTSALRLFGARIEYRPWPTWTIETFIEDQFARTPSFGPAEIADRKVLGWSLFREWGY